MNHKIKIQVKMNFCPTNIKIVNKKFIKIFKCKTQKTQMTLKFQVFNNNNNINNKINKTMKNNLIYLIVSFKNMNQKWLYNSKINQKIIIIIIVEKKMKNHS